MFDILIQLGENFAALLSLIFVFSFFSKSILKNKTFLLPVVIGFLFSAIAIYGMLHPTKIAEGVIVDARTVFVALAGVFGGPLAALIATLIVASYRIYLGGVGVFSGVSIIIMAAILGSVFSWEKLKKDKPYPRLFLLGIILAVFALLFALFFLPQEIAFTAFQRLFFPVLILYPLAIVVYGYMFSFEFTRQETALKLRESEAYFRLLAENSTDMISRHDTAGKYLYASPVCRTLLGYDPEELIGRSSFDFIHPDDIQIVDQARSTIIEQPIVRTTVYRICRKDGNYLWMETTSRTIFDKLTGKVLEIHAASRDVTERKRAEAQLAQQLNQLQLLRTIDMAIITSVDLQANLRLIARKTIEQFQVDAVAILLLNPKTQMLDFAAGEGFRSATWQFPHPEIGTGTASRAALQGSTLHIPALQQLDATPELRQAIRDEGFVSYYGIPLIAKNQLLGVLDVFTRTPLTADADWLAFAETLARQISISVDSATLFSDLQKSNIELAQAYDATLEGWSFALDLRDKETEGHTRRVTEMSVRLARAMGLAENEILQIKRGALLHDIGKMGIPDAILLKADRLTEEEWIVMRKHPTYAYDMLSRIDYLKPALDIPYCHHEKWDGSGYPQGLTREQIPLAARLFAVVDVWDALSHDRPYRAGWSQEKVIAYLRAEADIHFDPQAVSIFLRLLAEDAASVR